MEREPKKTHSGETISESGTEKMRLWRTCTVTNFTLEVMLCLTFGVIFK